MANELSPEEAERIEKLEKKRATALKNLSSGLWSYALPTFATHEMYGKLASLVENSYMQSLEKAPSQDVYDQLYKPALQSKGGAITSPYLQETSAAILQESVLALKVSDVAKAMGGLQLKEGFDQDAYVHELDKEVAGAIVGSYINYATHDKLKGVLDEAKKGTKKNLEDILKGKDSE